MRLAVTKILIFIFMGLFTALSLADTVASREKRANALINQLRLSKPVDLTVIRPVPKPPVARKPASIKKAIPWLKIPFFDIGDWYGRNKLFGGEGEQKDAGNTGMGEDGHDHDHDHGGGGNTNANGGAGKDKATGFGYDDNRTKTAAETPAPPPPPENKQSPGGGAPPPAMPPRQIHGQMYPVCMLFPPSVEGKADAIAKRFVQMANKCEVNINLFAIPIQEVGNRRDVNAMLNEAKATCNAQMGLGVKQASVMIASPDTIAADIMCDQREELDNGRCPGVMHNGICYKTNTAGCAQLCKASALTEPQLKRINQQYHGSGGFGEGIIPSIIDAQGHSGETASHEAMGHSQMCWPNGKYAGNGIGVPGEELRNANGGFPDESGPGDYTEEGCVQMRKNAIPNTAQIGFDPNFNDYYRAGEKRWALGEPYWLPYGNPQPPPGGPATPPTPPPALASGGNPPGQEPVARPAPQSANPQNAPPPSGHKKKSGGGPLTVVSLRNGTAGQDALNGIPDVPGGTGKPGGTETFGYDESNLKNVVSGNATSGAAGGAGGVKGFGYDENNAKLAADGSGGSGAGGPGAAEAGVAGATGSPGAAGLPGRGPASILNDVKNNGANMDDAFWKKLKQPPKEEAPGLRGSSLRGYDKPAKPLYQGGGVGP